MRWLGLFLLASCKFSANVSGDGGGVDGKEIDAAIDAPPDAFDDKCFGAGTFYFCLSAVPSGTESLDNNATFDTTACNTVNAQPIMIGATQVCALAAETISLSSGQDTVVTGNLPLVLVAVTSITIDGNIDASSFDLKVGPGANSPACDTTGIDGTAAAGSTGGGGAGGTFGTIGGNGGTGGVTAGGVATTAPPKSTILRGGCKGGTGMPGTAGLFGLGGNGGGAIFLASQGTITINGAIDASGGGADGGQASKGGGGGGGSGGMIVFHSLGALTIGAAATLNANGGGGGGGAGNVDPGDDGSDPIVTTPLVVALGGQTATAGRSKGGDGAAGPTAATPGANGGNGGGGGGGGHGLIRVLRGEINFPAGTVSPTPVN